MAAASPLCCLLLSQPYRQTNPTGRFLLLMMRDMIPEREINAFQLPEHDDYDYDLYFFVPSRFPYIVSPEDLTTLDQLEVGLSSKQIT